MYAAGNAPAMNDLMAARNFTLPVRLKLVMEEPYVYRIIPPHYNSKECTGLVGLENLGATCYLNALLQVGFLTFIFVIRYVHAYTFDIFFFLCRCCTT